VRLNGINGANLELYFKSNGRCDVLINSSLKHEVLYPSNEWFTLQINLYSKSNEIWLGIGGSDMQIPWAFTGRTVHVDEIEAASAPGPNWPTEGQPLFHLDDMEIKASGSVLSAPVAINPEISFFPNPADELLYINIPEQTVQPGVSFFDFSGRRFAAGLTKDAPGLWRIDTRNLVPGIYLIQVISEKRSSVGKICISR
jgi:hypothetical protein